MVRVCVCIYHIYFGLSTWKYRKTVLLELIFKLGLPHANAQRTEVFAVEHVRNVNIDVMSYTATSTKTKSTTRC